MLPQANITERANVRGRTANMTIDPPSIGTGNTITMISTSRLTTRKWATYKRLLDITLCTLIIVVLSLPMGCIAILIAGTSEGPVLFRQQRRGVKGRHFSCYKFRTMYQHYSDAMAATQSTRNDSRVTAVGRWLRKTSLDELPQLFNVMLGDMSLVGPRPHALGTSINGLLLPEVTEDYMYRYVVRPGITGWAQVHGWRGILDADEKLLHRVAHDLHYIAHWTPLMDVRILLKTVTCVFDKHAF